MKNQITAIGLIATKSVELEEQLRRSGATGVGLKELSDSIQHLLGEENLSRMRKIYEFRNKAMHRSDFSIGQKALENYVADADWIINALQPAPGTDAYFRQRFKESDYVDEEMYQWALRVGARDIEERQARKNLVRQALNDPAVDSSEVGLPPMSDPNPEVILEARLEESKSPRPSCEVGVTGKARSGVSPQTKEIVVDGAIKVGIHLLSSMFKR